MAEYIDRKALDIAMTIAAANGKDKDRRTWAKAICVLHDMQTADVAPVVHGRWIKDNDSFQTDDYYCCYFDYNCSNCGEVVNDRYKLPKYCPECGAKMNEKEAVYD